MSMKIVAGMDEAGLGPRVGPLVVTAIRFELESESEVTSIDRLLSPSVSKDADPGGNRIRVDDSKVVFRGPQGMAHLEKAALSFWYASDDRSVSSGTP